MANFNLRDITRLRGYLVHCRYMFVDDDMIKYFCFFYYHLLSYCTTLLTLEISRGYDKRDMFQIQSM